VGRIAAVINLFYAIAEVVIIGIDFVFVVVRHTADGIAVAGIDHAGWPGKAVIDVLHNGIAAGVLDVLQPARCVVLVGDERAVGIDQLCGPVQPMR